MIKDKELTKAILKEAMEAVDAAEENPKRIQKPSATSL